MHGMQHETLTTLQLEKNLIMEWNGILVLNISDISIILYKGTKFLNNNYSS